MSELIAPTTHFMPSTLGGSSIPSLIKYKYIYIYILIREYNPTLPKWWIQKQQTFNNQSEIELKKVRKALT